MMPPEELQRAAAQVRRAGGGTAWSTGLAVAVAAWLETEAGLRLLNRYVSVRYALPLTPNADMVAREILAGTVAAAGPEVDRVGFRLETMDGVLDLADVCWQQVEDDGYITGLTAAVAPEGLLVKPEHAGRAFADSEDHYFELIDGGVTWRPRKADLAVAEMREQRERRLCDPYYVPGGGS